MATSAADDAVEVFQSRLHYFGENLVGQDVEVTLKDGSVVTGTVVAADPSLQLAYCKRKEPLRPNEAQFAPRHQLDLDYEADIVMLEARDVHDSNSGGQGFTDSEISGTMSPGQRKELVAADNTWVQAGEALEDGAPSSGSFDQFAAYRARGGVESYSDDLYSTKLDMSRFTAAEIAEAQRVADESERKEKAKAGKGSHAPAAPSAGDGSENWGDSAIAMSADQLEADMVGPQGGPGGGDAEGNEEALYSAVQPERRMGQTAWAQGGRGGFAGGSPPGRPQERAPYRSLTGQRNDQRGQQGGYGQHEGGAGGQRGFDQGGRTGPGGGMGGGGGRGPQPPLPHGDRPHEGRGGYDNRQQHGHGHGHEGRGGYDNRQQQQQQQQQQYSRGGSQYNSGPGPAGGPAAGGGGPSSGQRAWGNAGTQAPGQQQQQQAPPAPPAQTGAKLEWRQKVLPTVPATTAGPSSTAPAASAPATAPAAPASTSSATTAKEETKAESAQPNRPAAMPTPAPVPAPEPARLEPSPSGPTAPAGRAADVGPQAQGMQMAAEGEAGETKASTGKKPLNVEAAEFVPAFKPFAPVAEPPAEVQQQAPVQQLAQVPLMPAMQGGMPFQGGIPVQLPNGMVPMQQQYQQQAPQRMSVYGMPSAGYAPPQQMYMSAMQPFAQQQLIQGGQPVFMNNGNGVLVPMQGQPLPGQPFFMVPQQPLQFSMPLQLQQPQMPPQQNQQQPQTFIPVAVSSVPPRSPAQASMGMPGPMPPPLDAHSPPQNYPQQMQQQQGQAQGQGGTPPQAQQPIDRRVDNAHQLDVASHERRGAPRGGRGGGGGERGKGGGGRAGGPPRDHYQEGGHRGGYGGRGGHSGGAPQQHMGPLPGKDGRDSAPSVTAPPPPIAAPAQAGEGEPKKQGAWAAVASKPAQPASAAAGKPSTPVVPAPTGGTGSSPPKGGAPTTAPSAATAKPTATAAQAAPATGGEAKK